MGACVEGELLLLIDVNEIDTPVNTLQSYSQLPHTSQSMPIIIRQQQPHVIKLFLEQSLFSARCHECICCPIAGLISDQRLFPPCEVPPTADRAMSGSAQVSKKAFFRAGPHDPLKSHILPRASRPASTSPVPHRLRIVPI